jgi:hypothetical protein
VDVEMEGDVVERGARGPAALGQYQGGADEDAEEEGGQEQEPGQPEGAEDDPHEVEDGLFHLDPGDDGLLDFL